MALLFTEGFDALSLTDLPKKWETHQQFQATAATVSNTGRRNSGAFAAATTGLFSKAIFKDGVMLYVGMAVKFGTPTQTSSPEIFAGFVTEPTAIMGPANIVAVLRVNTNNTISFAPGTNTTGALPASYTSTATITRNTWNYIEFKLKCQTTSVSAGEYAVKLNGAEIISLPSGAVLAGSNTSSYGNKRFFVGTITATSRSNVTFDDIYICDEIGTKNNTWLGDVRIDAVRVSADGTYKQFTPSSGTSNFAMVNETSLDTATHVKASAVNATDTYQITSPVGLVSETIHGVVVNAYVNKTIDATKRISPIMRQNSVDAAAASVFVPTDPTMIQTAYDLAPDGTDWTPSKLSSAEAGIKIII